MTLASLAAKWKTLASLLVLIAVGWCFFLWQPERQVRLHQRHLLEAAQNRDWPKLKALLDDSFRTSGGHDKTAALGQAADVLRQFFSLEITGKETVISLDNLEAKVTSRLRINGKGMPLANAVQELVNTSPDPFEFTWRRKSWKPWDWSLVYTGHPLIIRTETGEWPL